MSAFLVTLFALQLLAPSPSLEALRRTAETLNEAGNNSESADAWLALAEADPAQRSDALDEAHINLLAVYFYHQDVAGLCRAIKLAESVLRAGGFANEGAKQVWQDRWDYLEDELRTHSTTTNRSNCRFTANGHPRVRVALLPDTPPSFPELAPQEPHRAPPTETATQPNPAPGLPVVDRVDKRRRVHLITGAVFASVATGLSGGTIGALAAMGKHHAGMHWQLSEAPDRNFTADEYAEFQKMSRQAHEARGLAIGLGVAASVSLTTAIIVWATAKNRRDRSRTSRVRFDGTQLRF